MCPFCGGYHSDIEDLFQSIFDEAFEDIFRSQPTATPRPPSGESSRVRGLLAMARQNASPNERDIAIIKLTEMGKAHLI